MVEDIVLLNEGDIVLANCTVLSLGMDHCDTEDAVDGRGDVDGGYEITEMVMDIRSVTGEVRPIFIELYRSNGDGGDIEIGDSTLTVGSEVELYCGPHVQLRW